MTIKTARIIKASTLFVPYWLFLCFCLCIFPGIGGFILGFIRLVSARNKIEANDALIIMFAPVTMVYFDFLKYVATGNITE